MLLQEKPENRLRKAVERFCSQMFDSSSCLQVVHCCSMCVSSPIVSWLIQAILVQEQPHIRPVPLHCHKAFPLTPPIGHAGFGAHKDTQEVGAGDNVHLMSQRSPGIHRGQVADATTSLPLGTLALELLCVYQSTYICPDTDQKKEQEKA